MGVYATQEVSTAGGGGCTPLTIVGYTKIKTSSSPLLFCFYFDALDLISDVWGDGGVGIGIDYLFICD